MSLINTEIKPFTATAFHNGEFVAGAPSWSTPTASSSSTRSPLKASGATRSSCSAR